MAVLILFFISFLFFYPHPAIGLHYDRDLLWEEIRKFVQNGNYESALDLVDLVQPEGESRDPLRSQYLRGSLFSRLGRGEDALAEFQKLAGRYPEMEDYRLLNVARIQNQLGRFDEASESARLLREGFPDSRLVPHSLLEEMRSSIGREDPKRCEETETLFLKDFPTDERAPEVLYLSGRCREELGDWISAYQTYQKIYYEYPASDFSEAARKRTVELRRIRKERFPDPDFSMKMKRAQGLTGAGLCPSALEYLRQMERLSVSKSEQEEILEAEAACHRNLGNHQAGMEVAERLLREFPNPGREPARRLQLARAYWNLGDDGHALEIASDIQEKFPEHPLAANAEYILGRIHESRGEWEEARSRYGRLAGKFPDSNLAEEALWRIGWTYYLSGRYPEMESHFRGLAQNRPDSENTDMFLFWQAEALRLQDRKEECVPLLERISSRYPFSFYGGRARIGVNSPDPLLQATPSPSPLALEWAQEPVSSPAGNETEPQVPVKPNLSSFAETRLARTEELVAMGFGPDAELEIRSLGSSLEPTGPNRAWLALQYGKAGLYYVAIPLLEDRARENGDPLALSDQLFPKVYWDEVEEYSGKAGLDPLLVLAVIRQESVFNPRAVSPAQAMGLMQLLPSTGRRLYDRVSPGNFREALLWDPEINVELGTLYLAELLNLNDKNLFWTLVSYNAGIKKAELWRQKFGDLPLEAMVESISFPETRRYVKKVMANYETYRLIRPSQNPPATVFVRPPEPSTP